ncbi:hypothetical protein OG488_04570 [Streptomyces sp. NBC_01460]|uniref:hypothetical protein n=1 Tax=Streptomyces sp. NBC_01460 TaxID=2903875 RepID=UPI002E32F71B|nr:hypothetical protein [Streptomyces sp. NBC_01460]
MAHCGTLVSRADLGSIRTCACTHHGRPHDLADALVSVPKPPDRPESFDTTARDPVEQLTPDHTTH